MNPERRILCLTPRLRGVGGMVSFQQKLVQGLAPRRVDVTYNLSDRDCAAVLVIGGTRHLGWLIRAKRRGVRIVQRLDGMNWLHRLHNSGVRHYLRAEYGNLLLAFIRSRLADAIIYQSQFSRTWWERARGQTRIPSAVVYNGVDLSTYTPHGAHNRPSDRIRILLVEGSLIGGYELGLEVAVSLAKGLLDRQNNAHRLRSNALPVELVVAGRVSPEVRQRWERSSPIPIVWLGLVPSEEIPELDRSAHLLYSSDVHPACPNSVIEALACGLPVLAYDTGALPEMVTGMSGRVVPYGGDAWRLEKPDLTALVDAGEDILLNQEAYRLGARRRAEEAYGLDQMVAVYMNVLLDLEQTAPEVP